MWWARRDLNPGPPAPKTGALTGIISGSRGAAKNQTRVTPSNVTPFLYLQKTVREWGIIMNQVIVEGSKLILEFQDQDKLSKFLELLRYLGLTRTIKKKEIVIKYDELFRRYLEKDRQLDERTITDYMRYLRKLDGKTINYDLYLSISHNKWLTKTVRLYLDYLYKTGNISWEDYQKMKEIFKVRKNNGFNNHKVDPDELVGVIYDERLKEPELLVFEILLYSGTRFSEVIKLINEFNEERLECFEGFCRYSMFWARGRKRCDWIYLPVKLVQKLRMFKRYYKGRKTHSLSRYFEKKYKIDLKLFRKLFYRVCRETCEKEICDFIQSRISKLSIGDIHYDDLLSRADKNYMKIVRRIDELINELLSEDSGEEGTLYRMSSSSREESGEIIEYNISQYLE